ncbi:MAG: hypothetical protein H6736_05135 [Alphaproteobacteria bacterium]|nr:hypothetical protein [Alphaproteobacteria bacterium]MCB9691181.1 hypothetical protein [Alphaproteobacteria bacterium]
MLALLLTGCFTYTCGDYAVTGTIYGDLQGGEWCGLNGTYGFLDSTQGVVQIIITPNARDFETDASLTDVLAITDLRFAADRLVTGEVLTTSDGLVGLCGLAPQGAGSASLVFTEVQGSLTIGQPSNRTLTGDEAWNMVWDLSCPATTASGDDLVELTYGEVF